MSKKEFWLNGNQYAVIYEDGDIYIGGEYRGKLYSDGNLYIDGKLRGKLYDDGELYIDGEKIGTFYSDGEYWSEGKKQGKVYEEKTTPEKSRHNSVNDISEHNSDKEQSSYIENSFVGAGIGSLILLGIVIIVLVMISFYASYKMWISIFTEQLLNYSDQYSKMIITGCVIILVQAAAFVLQVKKMLADRLSNGYLRGLCYHMVAAFIHMTFAQFLLDGVPTNIPEYILPVMFVCFVMTLVPATLGWLIGLLLRLIIKNNKKSDEYHSSENNNTHIDKEESKTEDDKHEQKNKFSLNKIVCVGGLLGILIFTVLIFLNKDEFGTKIASIKNIHKIEDDPNFISDSDIVNMDGTTSFNKVNGALLVEQGNWVYYYAEEDHAIYKISPSGERILVVDKIFAASNLNIKGDWIYWLDGLNEPEVFKVRTDGKEKTRVLETSCIDYYIHDRYLYYMTISGDDYSVNKIDLQGETPPTEDLLVISSEADMGFVGVYNGNMYVYIAEDWFSSSNSTLFCEICSITEDGNKNTVLRIEEKRQEISFSGYKCAIDSRGFLWIVYSEEAFWGETFSKVYVANLNLSDVEKINSELYSTSNIEHIELMNYAELQEKFVVFNKKGISLFDGNSVLTLEDTIVSIEDVCDIYCTNQWIYCRTSYTDEDTDKNVSEWYRITYKGDDLEKIDASLDVNIPNDAESKKMVDDYELQHSKSEYEDLLMKMETCCWDKTFEDLDSIADLELFFAMFVTQDYSDAELEQWYSGTDMIYDIPGEVFRKTITNHFAIDKLNLDEYFHGTPGDNPNASWYDAKNDVYHGFVGGFGGPHDGYERIEIEIIEYGIVKATGYWTRDDSEIVTASVIVEESPNGNLRLKSYMHSIESKGTELSGNSKNPSVIDSTKGNVTLTGTLEFRTTESSSGNGYVKEHYILHLDPPIKELIYYDLDTEANESVINIAELDVFGDLGGIKGEYDGDRLTITGEILQNYTSYFFTYFSIRGTEFVIEDAN